MSHASILAALPPSSSFSMAPRGETEEGDGYCDACRVRTDEPSCPSCGGPSLDVRNEQVRLMLIEEDDARRRRAATLRLVARIVFGLVVFLVGMYFFGLVETATTTSMKGEKITVTTHYSLHFIKPIVMAVVAVGPVFAVLQRISWLRSSKPYHSDLIGETL